MQQRLLRGENTKKTLEELRSRRSATMSELAESTGLSRGTVRKILDRLENHEIVVSDGKSPSSIQGGKPASLFRFHPRARFALGMHISFHYLYARIVDLDNVTVAETQVPISYDMQISHLLSLVQRAVEELLGAAGVQSNRVLGLAVGGHGVTDYEKGIVLTSPHNPSWGKDLRLRDLVAEKLGGSFPVFVDNAIRYRTYAERALGWLRNASDAFVIHCTEGLIAGVMVNGMIRRGPSNLAGAIGHMKLKSGDSVRCACGGYGCFETLVIPSRLIRQARTHMGHYPDSELSNVDEQQLTVERIFKSADNGDALAQEIVDEAAYWFAVACQNLALTLDPEIIVLQGIYAEPGQYFKDQLASRYGTMSLIDAPFRTKIAYSSLGEEAASVGAALYVVSKVLE